MTGKTIVISQPMFFPWIGLFEQIALADTYIHYDDVQMPQGRSFMARVQLRDSSPAGQLWLSAPIEHNRSGELISETFMQDGSVWRSKHLKTIVHLYGKAPYFKDMFAVIEGLYGMDEDNLAIFNMQAIERISEWFGLDTVFRKSSEMGIGGSSSQRLFDLCKQESASCYVTGLGALNYLDHDLFDRGGIDVCYMDYQKKPYKQLHDPFIPYVSIMDVMANLGPDGREWMISKALYWKEYVAHERDRKVSG